MANPINYFVAANCGLDIIRIRSEEEVENEHSNFVNPTDHHKTRDYWIGNLRQDFLLGIPGDEDEIDFSHGTMSPIDELTLPPYSREEAGIHSDAKYFAFVLPPKKFSKLFDYNSVLEDLQKMEILEEPQEIPEPHPRSFRTLSVRLLSSFNQTDDESMTDALIRQHERYKKLSWALFAASGGFIYYNSQMQPLGVNALSFKRTKYRIDFAGPFRVSDVVCKGMFELERSRPMKMQLFHEAGFVAVGWVRPNETFEGQTVGEKQSNVYGALVFHRDLEGGSVAYLVRRNKQRYKSNEYPTGDFETMFDAFKYIPQMEELSFSVDAKIPDDLNFSKQIVNEALQEIHNNEVVDAPPNFGEKTLLLHKAIRCKFNFADIKKITEYYGDDMNETDNLGFTPLHYGCRFKADDEKLIQFLLSKNPNAVKKADQLNRYPLHIACDSNASPAVIRLLLGTEIVSQETKHLKQIPVHIALNSECSFEIIKILLDADKDRSTIRRGNFAGMLPLHIAIKKRMPHAIIEMLLEADNSLDINKSMHKRSKSSIYRWYHGMKPLHMACLERLETRTVKLLLDKDTGGSLLKEQLLIKPPESRSMVDGDGALDDGLKFLDGMRPLHLSLLQNTPDTTRVLLQKEKNSNLRDWQEQANMLGSYDERTCLHIACKHNNEYDIIKLLLIQDPDRSTVRMRDKKGSCPLHLACNHSFARKDVIQELLDEDMLNVREVDLLGRNALSLAVKANAPHDVLDLLLKPQYFDAKGFDVRTINELAVRVKNDSNLQAAVNLLVSQRIPYCMLCYQLYVHLVELAFFLIGVDNFLRNEERSLYITLILSLCATSSIVREAVQLISQGSNYIFDLQNLTEITNIGILIRSIVIFSDLDYKSDTTSKFVLIAGTFFHVMNLIFFLRKASLPFSRFAGGLVIIFYTLIPFFFVTALILLLFSSSFRIKYMFQLSASASASTSASSEMEEARNTMMEGSTRESCIASLGKCYLATLQTFVGGGYGADESDDYTLLSFDLVVALVLLNVVIAMISTSWENAKDYATDIFWCGRLAFLAEIRFLTVHSNHCDPFGMFQAIDGIQSITLRPPQFSWTRDWPYHLVNSQEEYNDPDRYFPRDVAHTIQKAKSPLSDLHWIKVSNAGLVRHSQIFRVLCSWLLHSLLYLFLLIVGLFSFGIFWPINFRLWLLSFDFGFGMGGRR